MIENTSSMDRRVTTRTSRVPMPVLIGGGILLIALAALFPLMRRWWRAERSVDASTLRVVPVTRGDLQRDLSVQARVVAALHPTLFSPAQGIVTVKLKAGSQVKKGDVIASIDSPELRSQFTQAQSLLISMRADLDRQKIVSRQTATRAQQQVDLNTVRLQAAKRNLERYERTYKEGLSNRADYESAQDAVRVSEMELDQARKELSMGAETLTFDIRSREQQVLRQQSVASELQQKVDDLVVRAPFDGMVASVMVQDRDAVAPNQAIVTVVNLSAFELELQLPEEYASETAIGTPATVSVDGKDWEGHVTAVSPEVVNSQVTATVMFTGGTPPGLKQSQRVTTRLVYESKKNVLKVPRGAFYEAGGGRTAYVVTGSEATRRAVSFGASSMNEIEVTSGLQEGEQIVVSDTTMFENANRVLLR
jgi:HlyD family secretion protein